MPNWTFYICTFGCKVNQYESEAIREAWLKLGGIECSDPVLAELIFINSCAITSHAEREARNAVFRLRRIAPHARLILSGCAAKLFEDFKPRRNANWEMPDLCLQQNQKSALLLDPWLDKPAKATEKDPFQIATFTRARPVLKVQDGCSQNCTYCIVPLTRGRPISRNPEDILAEAMRLLKAGAAELILSGVNLRQYEKKDKNCPNFWSLVRFLDKELSGGFADRARIRISSLEPSQLDDEGIECLGHAKMLCPHLHLSIQHASQDILRRMGRGHYKLDNLERALQNLSSFWPIMGLGADFLVAFPGESEGDFQELIDFIERNPFSYAHVFPFSARPGTAAAKFSGQLPKSVKQERTGLLRQKINAKHQGFAQALLSLDKMSIVLENSEQEKNLPALESAELKRGINEYYFPCYLARKSLDFASPRELLAVKPLLTHSDGLLVEII